MKLTAIETAVGLAFIFECSKEDRFAAKAAGFWFHGQGSRCKTNQKWGQKCPVCQSGRDWCWWTGDVQRAAALVRYADDAARAAIGDYAARLEGSKAADVAAGVAAPPAPDGLEYMPFQRAAIAYARGKAGVLLAEEMGLGKSIEALGIINDQQLSPVLIICPASLRINWLREAERWLIGEWRSHIVDTAKAPPSDADLVICNYDRIKGDVLEWLMARDWGCVVVDEAHYLKNSTARRSRAVLGGSPKKGSPRVPGLLSRGRVRLLLTGTPMPNGRPMEFFPLLHAVAPGEFGNFFAFAKTYCAAKQVKIGRDKYAWDFTGCDYGRLPELQRRARATCMVRHRKADVLTELPEKIRQVVSLPLNGAAQAVAREREAYSEYEDRIESLGALVDVARELHGDASAQYREAVEALRCATTIAFAEMSAARREVALAKLPAAIEHIRSLLDEEDGDGGHAVPKLAVWAWHHDVIDALMGAFVGAVRIDGRMGAEDRQSSVDRFQGDPSVRVFVGQIQAAGVGLTLTAGSHAVFVELSWVPSDIAQAEDRQHRLGQRACVHIQHLVVDGSIDAHMASELVAKQDRCDRGLDAAVSLPVPIAIRPRQERGGASAKQPSIATAQKAAVLLGLRMLAGVCDGAATRDGCGFNAGDAGFGRALAQRPDLTDGQAIAARRMIKKYIRQLGADLIAEMGSPVEVSR